MLIFCRLAVCCVWHSCSAQQGQWAAVPGLSPGHDMGAVHVSPLSVPKIQSHCESRSVCTYNGLFYILQPSPYQFVSLKWFVADHFSKSTRIKIENQQSSCCSPRVSQGSVKDPPCPEDIFLTNESGKILVYKRLSCSNSCHHTLLRMA